MSTMQWQTMEDYSNPTTMFSADAETALETTYIPEAQTDSGDTEEDAIMSITLPYLRAIFLVLFWLVSVVGNGLLLTGVVAAGKLKNPGYMLAFSQGVVDLLTALLCIPVPLAAILLGRQPFRSNAVLCRLSTWIAFGLYTQHCFVLLLMLGDRLLAVGKPFIYQRLVRSPTMKYRCFALIVLFWILSISISGVVWHSGVEVRFDVNRLYCLPVSLLNGEAAGAMTPAVMSFVAILVVGYSVVVFWVLKSARRVSSIPVQTAAGRHSENPGKNNTEANHGSTGRDLDGQDVKSGDPPKVVGSPCQVAKKASTDSATSRRPAIRLSIVASVSTCYYVLVWLPMALVIDWSVENKMVVSATTWIAFSSGCINPFLYGLRNEDIRKGIAKAARKLRR